MIFNQSHWTLKIIKLQHWSDKRTVDVSGQDGEFRAKGKIMAEELVWRHIVQ